MAVDEQDPIRRINRNAYLDQNTAEYYARADGLGPAETAIFERVKSEVRGGRILDLGVGGGRTTGPLLKISENYVGLDSSPVMIAASERRHPGVRFMIGDASDLGLFHDSEFDLAVFSFNGIDCVGHEERKKILREVSRVVKSGGYFVFSSHNRGIDKYNEFPFQIPPWSWNPLQLVRGVFYFLIGILRHWIYRRKEVVASDYAIINEPDHQYSIMTYYVTMPEQLRQLREAGFHGSIHIFNLRGAEITEDKSSRFLYYCAKK